MTAHSFPQSMPSIFKIKNITTVLNDYTAAVTNEAKKRLKKHKNSNYNQIIVILYINCPHYSGTINKSDSLVFSYRLLVVT